MKKNHLLMSAMLFCGLSLFTSCSEEKDNPAPTPVEPAVERTVFEQQFSKDLQVVADEFRLESAMKATTALKEFINALDEKALSQQVLTVLGNMIGGLQSSTLASLPEADQAAATACLQERFGMTAEELQALPGFLVVDAYKSIGKMKLTFNQGQCTVSNDADAFTIVNTNAQGQTHTIALTFNDERDGVRFFVARLSGMPVAIQLPKSIGLTMTTEEGQVLNGTINLSTIAPSQSQFINFKNSGWVGDGQLAFNVNSRQETLDLYVKHTEQQAFDLKTAFSVNGKELARVECNDMHDEYTDEQINSDEFKSLREMGPFFAASYEVLKALRGKSVDNVIVSINDNMVIDGKIDDIAKSLLALGNIRKLQGTQPSLEAVDKYTQELNSLVHFEVSQKNTGINAQGKLVTGLRDKQNGDYQPLVALLFDGETEALPMFDRMSEADMANYQKIMTSFTPIAKEMTEMIDVAKQKFAAIGTAVSGYFGSL